MSVYLHIAVHAVYIFFAAWKEFSPHSEVYADQVSEEERSSHSQSQQGPGTCLHTGLSLD